MCGNIHYHRACLRRAAPRPAGWGKCTFRVDPEAEQAILQVIVLHREFPAWAVWPPHRGRSWTAVRPASARAPGADLPMVWVQAVTAAELADRMRGVDAQLAAP